MTPAEAREWGQRIARRDADAASPDAATWTSVLAALAESADAGTPLLESFRAGYETAEGAEYVAAPPHNVVDAGTRSPTDASEELTAARDDQDTSKVVTLSPTLAVPSYLLPAQAPAAQRPVADVDETLPVRVVETLHLPFTAPAALGAPSPATPVDVDATLPPVSRPNQEALPFVPPTTARTERTVPHLAYAPTIDLGSDVDQTLPPWKSSTPTLPFSASTESIEVDATAFVSRDQVFGPALPFAAAKAPLTLEAYAAFLGDLARDPSRAAEVRAAHGLVDEAEQRAAGARFAVELARDPALRKRFDALVAAAKAKGR